MNILVFVFALELGIFPNGHLSMTSVPEYSRVLNSSLYGQFEAEFVIYDLVFVGGRVYTTFWKDVEGQGFSVDSVEYLFKAGIRYKWVELGFRHYCKHPVLPWYTSYDTFRATWEAIAEDVYIRFQGKAKM